MNSPGHAEQLQLPLPRSHHPDVQEDRIPHRHGMRDRGEKLGTDRIVDPPGSFGTGGDERLRVIGVTEDPGGSRKREVFQSRHQPVKPKGAGVKPAGKLGHVAMNGQDIGISGQDGTDGAITLRPLSMDDIGIDLTEFPSYRSDTTLIAGPEPPHLGHMETVVPDIGRYLGRGLQGSLGAGDDMDLERRGRSWFVVRGSWFFGGCSLFVVLGS